MGERLLGDGSVVLNIEARRSFAYRYKYLLSYHIAGLSSAVCRPYVRRSSTLLFHHLERFTRLHVYTRRRNPTEGNMDNQQAEPIYHMAIGSEFDLQTKEGGMYYSPTFENDKFIHATKEPQYLIDVANHFYKESVGEWVCIQLKPELLGGPVVYEAPAPVGGTEAYDHEGEAPVFPHIYGGIPSRAVTQRYKIHRAADGTFLSIEGITS